MIFENITFFQGQMGERTSKVIHKVYSLLNLRIVIQGNILPLQKWPKTDQISVISFKTRMTTSISSKAFEKKPQTAKE